MMIRLATTKILLLILLFTIGAPFATAQQRQMLSVTPPLFQLSVAPGDIWQSSVKVVNGNQHELTVYTEVVNFAPQGEQGQGTFIPIDENDDSNTTLSSWIEIPRGPYTVAPEQSREIPFFVEVPEDAAPGGHFAAILVGTQPPAGDGSTAVQTSQVVTSLFFARIEGDIIENGTVREFRLEDALVAQPEAEFVLRFENKGNVHLQPRGNIVITNMWGKERGVIPINNKTHFGNVLPESIREFRFSWKGESSITEIGRYKAVATLAYGADDIQNTSASTYFWVIPIKATLITVGSVLLFILFVSWAIKRYVRRMLTLAGVDVDAPEEVHGSHTSLEPGDVRISPYERISAPIRMGASEFKTELQKGTRITDFMYITFDFLKKYKLFFSAFVVIVAGLIVGVLYISDAATDQKNYEVTIDRNGKQTTVNSEEIIHEELMKDRRSSTNQEQHFELLLINESGEPGVAANAAVLLEDAGYLVASLETNVDASRPKTIIVYDESLANEAQALSGMFDNALLSATQGVVRSTSTVDTKPQIKIFFGEDRVEK